ncbi:exopolyphosphatase/guanosine-5'-triphosphate,3'-diphosphate pyrophosphatase [Geomicrobium halophilum]|uniref:Exopolyphosphatase/guanosine-5'-triphosphate, 3'-diphosphate pyrophosphatase n=1 Tax=Geomicrobium halophilum TaxID=549000 RepID=A0A841PNU0_9BACL|nr:Ppx/GppA family phosphatase [Geomicrobium halophilum]MBB6448856.1 exopolyphosphatase/guanosine-5'-triphosphate,3'-diphosphate pyrophosphatase [Geomicrobium halophilum]
MHETERIGVIDLGSNSIRLVIYTVGKHRRYRSLFNLKVAARLSQYLDEETQLLTAKGFAVLEEIFSHFKAVLEAHQVQEVRAVATAAVRKAKNREQILSYVWEKTGIELQVLLGQEEAYYSYLATIHSIDIEDGLIFDMGGSSTEVAAMKSKRLTHAYSFPIGTLTLLQLWDENAVNASTKRIKKLAAKMFSSQPWLKNMKVPAIGVGGSVRQLAAVHQHRRNDPFLGLHQYEMTSAELRDTYHYLRKIPLAKRGKVPSLSKDRADYIVPAGLFIAELLRHIQATSLIISQKGIRDGLLFESMRKKHQTLPTVKEETLLQLRKEYNLYEPFGTGVYRVATKLYQALHPKPNSADNARDQMLLFYSAHLKGLGAYIDEEQSHEHTFSVLTNRSLDGFTHEQQIAIALIASFTTCKQLRKKASQFQRLLNGKVLKNYEQLGAILRFSNGLFTTGRSIVDNIKIQSSTRGRKNKIFIYTKGKGKYFEEIQASKDIGQLEKALHTRFTLIFK